VINYELFDLPNLKVLKSKLPPVLHSSILKECLEAQEKNKAFASGLTGSGVPSHFKLEQNKEDLNSFVGPLVNKYLEDHPDYLGIYSILDNDLPLYLDEPWINLQEKYEFLPEHKHDGVLSYSIWIKIPYKKENEQHQKKLKFGNQKFYSFQFSYANTIGLQMQHNLEVEEKDEGTILLFPSQLNHVVYPFYTSDEYRISVSGNVMLRTGK